MGISYSAGVFFGVCVRRKSALGEVLEGYIDKQGGTRAATEVPGVVIGAVGDCGEWLTVESKGSAKSYGRNSGYCPSPALLSAPAEWEADIARFLLGVIPRETPNLKIGWHFQGSVF